MNTTTRTRCVWGLLALLSLMPVGGCYYRWVPQSEYLKRYQNKCADTALPPSDQIVKEGLTRSFGSSTADVWRACLRIAAQKSAVLAADGGQGGNSPRRLMIVDGQQLLLIQQASQGGVDATTFMDTWLAVTVVPDGAGCKVSVAWVHPQTNQVAPFPALKPEEKPHASIALIPPIAKQFFVARERKFVPHAKAEEFQGELAMQLYGPGQWLPRVKYPQHASRGQAPGVIVRPDPGYPQLKNDYGNWCSLLLRRNVYVVDSPELMAELTRILDDLKKAAGKQNMPTRLCVIASGQVNAFSLPNGDIFICAGLLDVLSDAHEVAAVLAHELDHYVQHDAVYKIQNEYSTLVAVEILEAAMVVGGSVAGAAIAPAAAGVINPGAQFASSMLNNAVSLAAAYAGAGIQDTVVMGYSQEVELRADRNAMRYMWSAGYDRQAMMHVMNKLKDMEVAAREAKANCGSALVNCKPGVETRLAEMKKVQEELDKAR